MRVSRAYGTSVGEFEVGIVVIKVLQAFGHHVEHAFACLGFGLDAGQLMFHRPQQGGDELFREIPLEREHHAMSLKGFIEVVDLVEHGRDCRL